MIIQRRGTARFELFRHALGEASLTSCALKRMRFIDAARPYSALLSMRSPVPELKDHVRSVSQRDSCGYPIWGTRSSRPLSRRWRNTVQETSHTGTHSVLQPKHVITLVPQITQRACAALGSSRSTPKPAARPQSRDFEAREGVRLEDSPRKVYQNFSLTKLFEHWNE